MRRRYLSSLVAVGALSGLLGGSALAQQPPPPKPKPTMKPPVPAPAPRPAAPPAAHAPEAIGAAKEEEPAPASAPTTSEADRALARGLLFAYEPAPTEIRVLAIEDLALLGDARALNVLATLVLDNNPQIQFAAVRAVRAFQTPRAEEILENTVRHPRTAEALKIYALSSLPFQRSPTAHEFLVSVAQGEDRYGPQVAASARATLQRSGEAGSPAGTPPPGSAPPPGSVPPPGAAPQPGTPPPPGS